MADIENASQHFKGRFFSTTTTIEWSAEQEGFAFKSEPANTARNLNLCFATGEERSVLLVTHRRHAAAASNSGCVWRFLFHSRL